MAVFPVGRRPVRAGGGSRRDRRVERRTYIKATPREVWAALHDPANGAALFPALALGPAVPTWPAAAATRTGATRLGLLRRSARLESLEARPGSSFRVRIDGPAVRGELSWYLEPIAGGTRVVHAARLEPIGRWNGILARLGGEPLGDRVDAHLRALKHIVETAERPIEPST